MSDGLKASPETISRGFLRVEFFCSLVVHKLRFIIHGEQSEASALRTVESDAAWHTVRVRSPVHWVSILV